MIAANAVTNFRARSRAWFMSCRACGRDFNHPPWLTARRHAKGEFAPPRRCSLCVMAVIMSWVEDEDGDT